MMSFLLLGKYCVLYYLNKHFDPVVILIVIEIILGKDLESTPHLQVNDVAVLGSKAV